MKRCTKCMELKLTTEFCKDKKRPDGRHPQCKSCVKEYKLQRTKTEETKNQEKIYQRHYARTPKRKAQIMEYQQTPKHRKNKRKYKLKHKYGITEEQYDEMMKKQGGVCAACRSEFRSTKTTHLDHCHATGKVRGILCHNCNRALGAVQDKIENLNALIDYLQREEKECAS